MFSRLIFSNQLVLLLCSFLFFSCLTNVEEQFEDVPPDVCNNITYSVHIQPILEANCIECHGAGGNFPDLTTFSSVSTNSLRIKSEVVARTMPIGGSLSQVEIDAISCWVDSGALNN